MRNKLAIAAAPFVAAALISSCEVHAKLRSRKAEPLASMGLCYQGKPTQDGIEAIAHLHWRIRGAGVSSTTQEKEDWRRAQDELGINCVIENDQDGQ